MDPNSTVLEISSDEEGGWESNINKGLSTDSFDDNNWIADLLDEVNRDNCGYNEDDDGDDSDEVVVVSEYLPKPKKKVVAKCTSLVEFDDDCMVLDHDPDKPLDARNDNPVNRDEDDENDDDVLVVSEKGQVACRDYPHSRHLCIKFPFSSSPNKSHCVQCYCYVCDSLAPCVYWGDGSYTLDHCQATDKDDFWIIERQNSKNGNKIANTSLSNQLPPMNLVPPPIQNPVTSPNPIQPCPVSSNFGAPNIVNQNHTPFVSSSNKYEPSLVSQQLIRSTSCTIPTDHRVYRNYDLGAPLHKPVFKRTVSAGIVSTSNRYSYSSYRDSYRNLSLQSNLVNAPVPFSSPNLSFEDPLPRKNTAFDLSQNFNPSINPDSCVETPVPVVFQPHTVSLSSRGHSSLPNYSVPSEAPPQEYQGQKSTVDPKFFNGISWQESQTNHQTATQTEGANLTNESSSATGSGGLVDYGFDNWMFNNQPCQPGSMDVSGTYGMNELSPESAFIDTGITFDF